MAKTTGCLSADMYVPDLDFVGMILLVSLESMKMFQRLCCRHAQTDWLVQRPIGYPSEKMVPGKDSVSPSSAPDFEATLSPASRTYK